jgi:hypothetical protein
MRPRLQLCALLLAWFMVTGSQWDLVQVFAWGRMFANYSRTMPLASALQLTFQPGNMCSMCKMVKAAKQQQEQSPATAGKVAGKILLVFEPVPQVVVACPSFLSWSLSDRILAGFQRAAPPVPPPRGLVA